MDANSTKLNAFLAVLQSFLHYFQLFPFFFSRLFPQNPQFSKQIKGKTIPSFYYMRTRAIYLPKKALALLPRQCADITKRTRSTLGSDFYRGRRSSNDAIILHIIKMKKTDWNHKPLNTKAKGSVSRLLIYQIRRKSALTFCNFGKISIFTSKSTNNNIATQNLLKRIDYI